MSRYITVVGPLSSKDEANQTMKALGESNHSVYSMGQDEDTKWFIERDTQAPANTIFGYTWQDIQNKQMKVSA